MINRRRFLASLPVLLAAPRAFAWQGFIPHRKVPVATQAPFVYFGTDTTKGVSKGVYLSRFDSATGKLTNPVLAVAIVRPSYFALGPQRAGKRILYVAAEGKDMEDSCIISCLIDPKTGGLTELNRVSSGGVGPCYISLDTSGESAYVANYNGGTVASYHVLADGKLSEPVQVLDFHDTARFGENGPVASRQMGPHPHAVMLSPDNRFLLVNDLGHDSIDVFPINPVTAQMGEMEPHRFMNNHAGSGPRHVAFHPNGRWVYGLNEIDSTIDRFLWQTTHKMGESQAVLVDTLTPMKMLAPGFPEAKNTAAEIQISSNGYFLYASNRGEDTLVVFSIDETSGDLKLVQRIACGGKMPRHFTLTPTQNWLMCENQDSATVTMFKVDGHSGKLTGPVQTLALDSPMFGLFA